MDLVWFSHYEDKVPHAAKKVRSFWWRDISSLSWQFRRTGGQILDYLVKYSPGCSLLFWIVISPSKKCSSSRMIWALYFIYHCQNKHLMSYRLSQIWLPVSVKMENGWNRMIYCCIATTLEFIPLRIIISWCSRVWQWNQCSQRFGNANIFWNWKFSHGFY